MKLIFLDIERKEVMQFNDFKVVTSTGSDLLLNCSLSIKADSFSGHQECTFLKNQIAEFGDNLKKIGKGKIASFEFRDLDKRLKIKFEANKNGKLFLSFELNSESYSSKLIFDKEIDFSCLDSILDEISNINIYIN